MICDDVAVVVVPRIREADSANVVSRCRRRGAQGDVSPGSAAVAPGAI
jgi:hypothetical protein